MRSIKINFNAENKLPDDNCLGRKGEHNATELNISLPEEMLNNADVEGVVIVFQVGAHRVFRSDVHKKAEVVSYKLPREVTCANKVDIQLEGYDLAEELIIKSEVIEGLYLEASVCGEDTNEEVGKSLVGEIAANTLARHTHENSSVLNKFGESEEGLTYDEKPVGASSGGTAQIELFNDDGNVFVFSEDGNSFTSGVNQYVSKMVYIHFLDPVEALTVGTLIAKIEIKESENSEYVSLASKCVDNGFPIVSLVQEVISTDYGDTIFKGYGMFGLPQWWQDLIDYAIDWHSIRITYYKN